MAVIKRRGWRLEIRVEKEKNKELLGEEVKGGWR
jgi:hypothetical protein